ncbi:MAG TPA: S8 family serine peptidase, partial [Candidatus Saccharimonadia bacterium]
DPYMKAQVDYAISKGVVVLAAAGNDGCNCMSYPANYPEVIAVGASDSANNTASFSSWGPNLDIIAPGTAGDVCSSAYTSTNATNAYTCSYAGTSLSTPIVAGLAALMLQQHPGASPATIAALIAQAAAKLPSMGGAYFTLKQGYGLVQAGNAIARVTIPLPFGQLLNKSSASLSSVSLATGADMDSTCMGIAGAPCTLTLSGPSGQILQIGQKILDEYGGAEFAWNANSLGLNPGQWTVTATTTYAGQTKTNSIGLTVLP